MIYLYPTVLPLSLQDHFDEADDFLITEEQNFEEIKRANGADQFQEQSLLGIDAAPKYGAGHEHKDTEVIT